MKRIIASVGLVAVGASGLQAAMLSGLTPESGKPFTVSATLRGFYDDNINTASKDVPIAHRDSFGFEVSPSIQFSFPMEQTSITFGYVYSFKDYENKPVGNADSYDQTHEFNAGLTHAFSERYQVSVRDSFVIGQEPDFLRAGNTFTTFQRISGDNMRNYGSITLSAQLTPEFSIELGYANSLYSYANNTPSGTLGAPDYQASNTGMLDEVEHVVHLDGRYQFAPQTTGILGYQFRETDYTGGQVIGSYFPAVGPRVDVMSDERNARSHYVYAGVDQNFRPDLTGSLRAGARFTSYYNNPAGQDDTNPYAMASLRYSYLPESSLEAGFSYDYSPSSYFTANNNTGNLTVSAQSATVYASLHHRITPKLFGSLLAQFQNSTYSGGTIDGKTDKYYLVGLNLQYRFTPNFSTEIGYNYDNVNSQVQNTYDRNRVYVGVTGSY
jgi:hypothetical protein